jgi:site-specific recombinase XerC
LSRREGIRTGGLDSHALPTLQALADAARLLRESVKDNSYRATPLGLEVARYIRWFRSEWGAAPGSIDKYEQALARLALYFADLELTDMEAPVGVERLRECLDHYWGTVEPATRGRVIATWRSFFDWAIRENRGIISNPARALTMPKRRDTRREPFPEKFVRRAVAQRHGCDRCGVVLVLLYGVRRAELAGVQFRHFDFGYRQLSLVGKGGKVRIIPIVEDEFWVDLTSLELDQGGPDIAGDKYLICPRRRTGMNTRFFHAKRMLPRAIDRWWYDRLEEVDLIQPDARRDHGMHRGRHTVATEILRETGNIVAAQELLGHSSPETTRQYYAGFDTRDLEAVIRAARAGKDNDR